jgi:replicative DNA helicase
LPGAHGSDVNALFGNLRRDAEDIANAVDAGMPEASTAALARLQSHIGEAERSTSRNGNAPSATTSAAVGFATPPAEALDAEEHVLGAMLLSPSAVKGVVAELRPEHFYRESHRLLYEAIINLDARGVPADAITVCDYVVQHGLEERVGPSTTGTAAGTERIWELANSVPSVSNAPHYARIIRRAALERRLQMAVSVQPRDPEVIAEAAAALTRERVAGDPRRALDGADWLESQVEGTPAIWGNSDDVIWAEGEPLMIYGPDGVGKTSVAQQIVLHLCGVRPDVLFNLPVRRAEKPILYLACDRPRQARRSLYRMVPKDRHDELRGRLLVWEGPLPFSIPASPRALLDFCLIHGAGTIVIDSLKDVAVELTNPEIALKVNQAFQWLNANGIELLVLHHPRKDPAGGPERPKSLEDVYGDRNFVAGMGSVVLLWGKGGDPVVDLRHLKQPAGEFGPVKLLHDHDLGETVLYEHSTMLDILVQAGTPLSVPAVAARFFASGDPSKNELEKTRRQLRKLVEQHQAVEWKDPDSGTLSFTASL